MKQVFLALTGLAALAAPAYAADAPGYIPPVSEEAPPSQVYARDWSGPYLGLQAGYGWSDATVSILPVLTGVPVDFDLEGFAGGVHGGWNWQSGSLVYGIDGEFNISDIDDGFSNGVGTAEASIDWFGSITGRIGIARDNWYVYGQGGFAFARGTLDVTESGDPTQSDHDSTTGWTLGLGLDYALNNDWLVGLNYKYYDFDDFDFNIGGDPVSMESDMHVVTLRLTREFGGQPLYTKGY